AALTGSTCDSYWTAFAPVSLSGGNDTTVADATCYRYRSVVTDHVGNSAVLGSADVVQVPDITPPSFVSATTNAAGTTLTIELSEPVDSGATTQPGAFTITYDGVAQPAPTSVSITGSTVVLGLASPPSRTRSQRSAASTSPPLTRSHPTHESRRTRPLPSRRLPSTRLRSLLKLSRSSPRRPATASPSARPRRSR